MSAKIDERIYTFNRYMKEKFGGRVARISFDTGYACPWGKCVFCRNDSFSPIVSVNMRKDNWQETLEKSMTFLKNRYNNKFFASYFQSGTSTFGPVDKLKTFFQTASSIKGVVAFIVSTRPDYIDEERINMILESVPSHIDEIWIELGLQSVKEESLKWIDRGHSAGDYFKAVELIEKYGQGRIKVAPHIILGIPGETIEDMINTVQKSIESPIVKGIKLHHLQIHHGTILEKMYEAEPFHLLSADEYINIMGEIIAVIPEDKVLLRLFTTAPEEYLIAPIWNLGTQEALQKLENWLNITKITQGCRR
ncbi:MAG TPA: TIGR01212 family radical SAM protein [bacterium]|nr:TIGR01212 family radical SAM protein [bacterium]